MVATTKKRRKSHHSVAIFRPFFPVLSCRVLSCLSAHHRSFGIVLEEAWQGVNVYEGSRPDQTGRRTRISLPVECVVLFSQNIDFHTLLKVPTEKRKKKKWRERERNVKDLFEQTSNYAVLGRG